MDRRTSRLAVGILATLAACSPPANSISGHAVWVPQAALAVQGDEATLYFGAVPAGTTATLSIELRNDGDGALTVRSAAGDAPFARPALDAPVQTGERASWAIAFTPTAAQVFSEDVVLSVQGAEPQRLLVLHLVGNGVSVDCDFPESIEFGVVAIGDDSSYGIQFGNPSAFPRVISLAAPYGNDPQAFSWSDESVTAPPGSSAQVSLTFKPTEAREYFALASLHVSDACGDATVALHGTGVTQLVSWNPTYVDCGWVPLGQRRAARVTFTNASRNTVTLLNFSATGDAEGPTANISLPAESETDVEFACVPSELGPRTGVVDFTLGLPSLPAGSLLLRMKGGGPELSVEPSPLDFGRIAWSATSPTTTSRQLKVQNVGARPANAGLDANLHLLGTPWLVFDARDGGGVSASDVNFAVAPLDDVTGLVSGQFTTAIVRMTPTHAGQLRFGLVVSSDDSSKPQVTVEAIATAVETPPCQLSISPTMIDFELLAPDEARHANITLTNLGTNADQRCFLSAIALADDAASQGFSLDGGRIEQVELAPQQRLTLTVGGAGTSVPGPKSSALTFEVNTPGNALRTVQLRSETAPKCLEIFPAPLDFGPVPVGCRSVRTLVVYNTCLGVQSVTALTGNSTVFSFDAGGANLSIGQSLIVPVAFSPLDAGAFADVFGVALDGGIRLFDITGQGVLEAQVREQFVVPAVPAIDVLFTEDSRLFDRHTDAGARRWNETPWRLADVVLRLADAGFDVHAGSIQDSWASDDWPPVDWRWNSPWAFGELVRSLDGGWPNGYVTSSTPDLADHFAQGTALSIAQQTSAAYVPFDSSVRAFSEPIRSTVNAGFKRDEVPLGIVSFGVIEDVSSNYHPDVSTTRFPIGYYEARLRAVNPAYSFNAIRAQFDSPSSDCMWSGPAGPDFEGRITGVVQSSGGVDVDICADWSVIIDGVANSLSATTRRFALRGVPDTSSPMVVSVNGASLTVAEWSYRSSSNAIELTAPPPPSATVEVRYFPVCE